ncbi:type II secretion system F family protein [Clostridium sp. Marseille-P299]|uniref:type II secretion system F family protein n=1 Tax=Clostridium sp. Marseille-P299 TaxID=1805477 RepID=UPI000830BB80|nr:type II secretion system F family protein [Clostridium sp. Marseille-P299]
MISNYSDYEFTQKELLTVIAKGVILCCVVGFIFYRSLLGIIILLPYVYFYTKEQKNKYMILRKQRLSIGFRDGIRCILAALEAGYSLENAMGEAITDLKLMYNDETEIIKEFLHIQRQVKNNVTIEEAMEQFALRSGIEDIESFAEVLLTAKRTGGDIVKVIRTTSNAISDKLEVKREIITMITAKQFEVTILKVIPFGIILYLWLGSPGFLDPLYHNLFGIVFMTIILVLYIFINKVANNITNIEI